IGRSEGAEIVFTVPNPAGPDHALPVFTTRPDTLYGVTFLAIAPEHPLAAQIVTPQQQAAATAYIEAAIRQSEIERLSTARQKSGVFSGTYAVHPLTGRQIPIWLADYVLTTYGTGAVMGVPAHDERDYEFAQKYDLPVVPVIQSPEEVETEGVCYTGHGRRVNSGPYDGLPSEEGGAQIVADLAARN